MVRLLKRLAPLNWLSIAVVLMSSFGLSAFNLAFPPKAQAAVTTLTSSQVGDSAQYISLSGYRSYIGSVTWPLRSSGCTAGSTSYKSIPWRSNDPTTTYNGDSMTGSGDCTDRYKDGGWSSGAWLSATAFNWATDGGHVLSGSAVAGSSNKATCYSGVPRIWGAAQDNSDHYPSLFSANGYAVSSNGYQLYSNGVTLFRKQFNLTAADISSINASGSTVIMQAVADDWMRVYVNGNLASTQNDSASSTNFSINKSWLREGANNIAFQVVDKAVWSTTSSDPVRGAALCYALTLDTGDAVSPPPDQVTCTVTSINPASATPGQTVASFDARISYTVNSGSFVPKFTFAVAGATPGSYIKSSSTAVSVGTYSAMVGPSPSNYPMTVSSTAGTYTATVTVSDNTTNAQLGQCTTSLVVGSPPPPPPPPPTPGELRLGDWDSITNLPPVL